MFRQVRPHTRTGLNIQRMRISTMHEAAVSKLLCRKQTWTVASNGTKFEITSPDYMLGTYLNVAVNIFSKCITKKL